jgi:hypothetical protein
MFPVEALANKIATAGNMPQILASEEYIKKQNQDANTPDGEDLPVEHFFLDGVYTRVLKIPKNVVLTGVIHKQEKITILASGKLRIADQHTKPIEIEAPYVVKDMPGIKRLILALEESVLINVFRTDYKDPYTILDHLGAKTCEEYAEFLQGEK